MKARLHLLKYLVSVLSRSGCAAAVCVNVSLSKRHVCSFVTSKSLLLLAELFCEKHHSWKLSEINARSPVTYDDSVIIFERSNDVVGLERLNIVPSNLLRGGADGEWPLRETSAAIRLISAVI